MIDGGIPMIPEPAPEIIMDARGIYWRRYPDMLSMVPVSDDNEPVPLPYIVYRRVGQETEHGFASTATGDLLARAERAESSLQVARDALREVLDALRDHGPDSMARGVIALAAADRLLAPG